MAKNVEESPGAVLRKRQLTEYHKLCGELRLRPNSGVLQALAPPSAPAAEAANAEDLAETSGCDDAAGEGQAGEGAARTPAVTARQLDELAFREDRVHDYDFSRNYLGDKQILPLAAALAVDPLLRSVIVSSSGLRDHGMVSLCSLLRRSATLEMLDVSANRFSIKGARSCLALVETAPKLHDLRAEDTCLDEDFCAKRGLRGEYASVRNTLLDVLYARMEKDSMDEVL
eukprot:TRINITY_DN18654_c1_g6_i1.p1 TRINITY_DN18654_c1_g6~~TRINITY_DN18654_c1_g6_i1.p1  ORF type:complete len:260 (-),score=52.35 TRINITY_DN18654_c1_g6_i1:13-699(-)